MPRLDLLHPTRLPLVAPSILSADFANMASDCRAVMEAGADLLHVDVMDGHFAPNLTIGPALCSSLRAALPDVFLDVHLMVTDPGDFIQPFADAGADNLTVHVEANGDLQDLASRIHDAGMTSGIAINPPTAFGQIEPWISRFDLILVMSVNPGFSGQAFIPGVLDKVKRIRALLRDDQRLQMDGGVSARTVVECREAGCDLLVAGSAVFGNSDYATAIEAVRGPASVVRSF